MPRFCLARSTWSAILLPMLLSVSAAVSAQSSEPGRLAGLVVDAASGEPLPGANVFLAHTMRGTAADAAGRYAIERVPPGTYELAVSMVGYAPHRSTVQVGPGRTATADVRLAPEVYDLSGVEVTAREDRQWQRRFDTFREVLLGDSPNADATDILNPFVVEFDEQNGVLTATAAAPLELVNRGLGYRITFLLESFVWNPHTESVRYAGSPFFEPLDPPSETEAEAWTIYRQWAYEGSLRHLIRALIHDRAFDEGFRVKDERGMAVDAASILQPSAQPGSYQLTLTGPLQIAYHRKSRRRPRGLRRDHRRDVMESVVHPRTLTTLVHADGSVVFPWDGLETSGAFYAQRLADMLPREYGLDDEYGLDNGPTPAERSAAVVESGAEAAPLPALPPRVDVARVESWAFITGEGAGPTQPAPNPALREAVDELRAGRWARAADVLDAYLKDHPDDLEAHYYRGIAARQRSIHAPLRRSDERAREHFDTILRQDSLYRDTIYQFALLHKVDADYTRAVDLAETQRRLRPDLEHVTIGLFSLYRHVLHTRSDRRARSWLDDRTSDAAAFFRSELDRLEGRLDEARAGFLELVRRDLDIPTQPVQLALARVYYARGEPLQAQPYVRLAIESISRPADAWAVFEDVKHLVTEAEWEAFQRIESAPDYVAFFNAFWARRDPTPAQRENVRLTEHYRRLLYAEANYTYYGIRSWSTDPDARGELDHPAPYALNEGFNDKGLIYIRHGEPDDRITTVTGYLEDTPTVSESGGGVVGDDMDFSRLKDGPSDLRPEDRPDAAWVPNESWRYYDPPMDFHFVVTGGGGNWRLTPRLQNAALIIDRAGWGGAYALQAQAARRFMEQLDQWRAEVAGGAPQSMLQATANQMIDAGRDNTRAADALAEEHRADAAQGLASDRHTWTDARPYVFPYLIAAFRGREGRTALDLHYAVPTGYLADLTDHRVDTLRVEVGVAVHDTAWSEKLRYAETATLPAGASTSDALVSTLPLELPPGAYHLALHQRPLDADLIAGVKLRHAVPDFSRPVLAVSDLLPAYGLTIPTDGLVGSRADLRPVVNPTLRFRRTRPFFIVFELYNLAFDRTERTDYTVEITLTPSGSGGLLRRGPDQPALSLKFDRAGTETAPVEFGEIDAGQVEPGPYLLTVTVTDRVTETTVERTRPIELTE